MDAPDRSRRADGSSGELRPGDGDGAADAVDHLPEIYQELRELAEQAFRRHGGPHTLQPTAVVHEAYLKLVGVDSERFSDRGHFFAVAAKAMRQVLLNHHRDKQALKRGGEFERITLSGCDPIAGSGELDFLALDEALTELIELDPRQGRIVELRFFGGLTMPEIAAALEVSLTTVESEWRHARAWLKLKLDSED